MSIEKHLEILGKVQGVGFRAFVLKNAQNLNIDGWVRNTYDGKVEAVFSGSENAVDKIISKVRKGPRWADVEKVNISDYDGKKDFKGFHIRS
ncbi:MAG: acylphosphatase [Halanaerobiaceae bacterium]